MVGSKYKGNFTIKVALTLSNVNFKFDLQYKSGNRLSLFHRSYSRLEEMLCQIEQKNGVAQRWQTNDESFQRARNEANDKQKKALLCKVTTSQHQILNRLISRYQIQDDYYAKEVQYKMLWSQFTEMSIPCIIYVCFGLVSLWLEVLLQRWPTWTRYI